MLKHFPFNRLKSLQGAYTMPIIFNSVQYVIQTEEMLILCHYHFCQELLSQGKQDIRKVICAIHLMSIIKQYAAPNGFIFCSQSAVKPCGYTQNVKQIIFQQILFSLPLFSTRALLMEFCGMIVFCCIMMTWMSGGFSVV